jgi:pimeloyl-ACP methyl ester carboxylesterase
MRGSGGRLDFNDGDGGSHASSPIVGGAGRSEAERVMSRNVRTNGSARAPTGRFVELPGRGRTFVREHPGPAGAPTVVLLHGWTATAALNWSPSFGPLAERFRVIALDHRGHGRGLRATAPFRLEDCADDVAALLRALGISECIVAGYSMGGPIAQLLWRRHPAVVAGLVLCATSATFHGTPREWVLSGLATGGSFVVATSPLQPMLTAAMTVLQGWPGTPRLVCGGDVVRHDWTKILEAGREICRFDSRSWLHELSVPTAVIATSADDLVPPRRQLALADAIPNATLRLVSGGHAVCTADPRRFVPALVGACSEVAARAAIGKSVVDHAA